MFSGLNDPTRWVLPEVLTEMARRRPDAPWIQDSGDDSMTFGQAQQQCLQAASFLHGLGVTRGERVGVLLNNGCDFVRVWLGLGKLGAIGVLLNTELRGRFLEHQLNDSAVSCLVLGTELLPVIHELTGRLAHLQTVVYAGAGAGDSEGAVQPPPGVRAVAWSGYGQAPPWTGSAPGPADIACIMYTSGTSGPSKGVLMPHAHCALYGVGAIRSLELAPGDHYYITLPLFHANGLLMQLAATLLAGIRAFVRVRFSATGWLSDVQRHGCTVTNFLGATAAFVIAQPATDADAKHSLRAVLSAPNLPLHEETFRSRFGVRDVLSGFGMTESNIPAWGRLGCSAPGAAGWPHEEYFEVRIADPETDMPVPTGTMGEIQVRPRVAFGFMAGYFNAPEKTVEAWRNLWFHTGDAGTLDETGLLTFIDRIKDCIRRRGQNISATEVEAVVMELPGIAEVAAYAVSSDIAGAEDEVMLALVAEPGVTVSCESVVRQASERLPRFAVPRYVRLMDVLPKTATGKVQRAVLRKQGTVDALDMSGLK